ncbi:hypothetical protein [Hirschia baltica]|uniref:Uncharacterized protein n=1 Tax=Hirschia baltica (strain ATCC 49814 / DSM 5838 / IFAM 1418) TaxID=582402 RepID=C6XMY3_HIRBI|nr:hypothetical protein [Hirschia baltica]ACT58153.1 hypothetical protein Hbal_0451 [Hirschia baltica ATCC 49814]
MNRYSKTRTDETETNALARRLVERSGLDEGQANQAVDDYLHAEGGSFASGVVPKRSGKVDLSRAN